jgi:hypothetical protein
MAFLNLPCDTGGKPFVLVNFEVMFGGEGKDDVVVVHLLLARSELLQSVWASHSLSVN